MLRLTALAAFCALASPALADFADLRAMAPIMPSKATATKTSTSVKPASDLKRETAGEDIRADLYRFFQLAP